MSQIMDHHGRLCVLEWDMMVGLKESCSPVQVHKDCTNACGMHANRILSSPLLLLKDAATCCYSPKLRATGNQNASNQVETCAEMMQSTPFIQIALDWCILGVK